MGLDMYLRGKKYVQDWPHMYKDGVIPEDSPSRLCQQAVKSVFPVNFVVLELGYWRKANAIHKFFVDNVQDGNDDCGDYYVDRAVMEELRARVIAVLEDFSKARELLPPQAGFFFGSTDMDEHYVRDLEYTKELMDNLLVEGVLDGIEVYYHSSW